jgi:23S rRNA (pseudouridine1915-N3)-methyltransferase
MKFRFLWPGKTRNKHLLALEKDFYTRLSRFIKCEILEIKPGEGENSAAAESQRFLKFLNPNTFVVVLSEKGQQTNSPGLAEKIKEWENKSLKEITFVIGGAEGVSPEIVESADYLLSLSFLTFTHEMARVLLLEQLYRAYSILKGLPYQK